MDTIKFVIENYVDEEAGYRFPVVNIYINGQDLIDIVTRAEQKSWDGNKNTRSSYIGFEVNQFHQFHDEMLGKKRRQFSVILTCTCTYAECNCIMANMAYDTHTVAWNDMKSPLLSGKTYSPFVSEEEAHEEGWQPLDYSGLGPFVFERRQYLSALDAVTQEWHQQKL